VIDRPLFLVGFMGSGKSTAARLVGRLTGWPVHDTDELVEQRAGRSIEQIFRESGEGPFRQLEWEALQGLSGCGRAIVATGGGLFAGLSQRRHMAGEGWTVWLDVPLAECLRRVGAAGGRPLWPAGDPLGLQALYEKRRAVYALADRRVPGEGEPEAVARRLLRSADISP
jgi:shikimate kinase